MDSAKLDMKEHEGCTRCVSGDDHMYLSCLCADDIDPLYSTQLHEIRL